MRFFVFYNPSVTASRATSLCTREAFLNPCKSLPHPPFATRTVHLSLRLGHARGLTVHRTVIQYPRAASLLAAARSPSGENNTQLFSYTLRPLRYPSGEGLKGSKTEIPRSKYASSRLTSAARNDRIGACLRVASNNCMAGSWVKTHPGVASNS